MNFEIKRVASYIGHKDSVYDLTEGFSSDKLLSASGDGFVVEWESPENGLPLVKVNHPIYAIENIKERNKLWVGENTQGLHAINTEKKQSEAFLKLGKATVFSIKSINERTFAGNNLGFIHVIDNYENKFITHIQASQKSVRTLAINSERNELAAGFSDHSIKIYDLQNLSLKHHINAHSNSVFTLLYHENYLFSSGRDAHIKVWDSSLNYIPVAAIPAHNYSVNHILKLENTELLASCSMDKSIKIWNINTLKLLKVIDKGKFAGHGTSVNKLWWSKEDQRLFSASDDRTISEWKLF